MADKKEFYIGQKKPIRQSFQSRNIRQHKNCWKANQNESPKGTTKHIHCVRKYIADLAVPYFAGKRSMQLFTGCA